jgi:hypothetical protein
LVDAGIAGGMRAILPPGASSVCAGQEQGKIDILVMI